MSDLPMQPGPDASGSGPSEAAAIAPEAVPVVQTGLADGEWHRLHRASPLFKGGIALIAILGVVVANLRERLIDLFLPGYTEGDDPVDLVLENGFLGWALLAVAGLLVVLIIGFYISWRMHTFRVTDEVVEVRSGIIFRTHRRAPLDRIQGINIGRPFIPRLFGASKLEISQAGQDANVQLAYLGSSDANDLRREILRLASGTREERTAAQAQAAGVEGFIDARVQEFLAPEITDNDAPPESIVRIGIGRLIGSVLLSVSTFVLIAVIIGAIVAIVITGELSILFGVIPALIGFGSFWLQRFTRSLRYSIAGTRDGVRIGYGLLSTTNETLPPGRIHSIAVDQPILWRFAGWWEIKVNRASQATAQSVSGGIANTTILPVGDEADVMNVLRLLLPDLDDDARALIVKGLAPRGETGDRYENSPKRAAWLRWFSWRRNGFAVTPDAFFLRRGAIWRELVIVPAPRVQSAAIQQGPVGRMTRLATVHLHTVMGPITASLGAIDVDKAMEFFADTSHRLVDAAARDRSHRWAETSDELGAPAAPTTEVSEPEASVPPAATAVPRPEQDPRE
ncbi:MAG: PH domain-containing protein [Salinibacterium sp.]|nr:PH domain-containing protein [Salinibacterium sp.]MBF0672719.1 PH domain-containing protein [Salinibacterium sp.]